VSEQDAGKVLDSNSDEQIRLMGLPEAELLKAVEGKVDEQQGEQKVEDSAGETAAPPPEDKPAEKTPEQIKIEELEAKLMEEQARAAKRVTDTQRKMHELAGKLSEYEKKLASAEREKEKPDFLRENPEVDQALEWKLEELRKEQAAAKEPEKPAQADVNAVWFDAVRQAFEDAGKDFDQAVGDKDLLAGFQKLKEAAGERWNNPAIAALRMVSFMDKVASERDATAKAEAARKEKLAAMAMPTKQGGGSPARSQEQPSEEEVARAIRTLPADKLDAYLKQHNLL
jgi:hypothetical protein